jgi:pimeloyl-ACP methyl ester carboxylesterase
MPRIVIGDGALYYERQGVGFPVMLVSGLAGFASFWHDQAVAFAKNFDVITHDHRGIGQSDLTRSGFTVDRMAADVIGLMDALEIERAHIVGHSTGGAIAQILAVEHPKRLASVVLSATWTKPDAYFRRLFALRKDILLRLGPRRRRMSLRKPNSRRKYASGFVQVADRTTLASRLGCSIARVCAIAPPVECPTIWARSISRASISPTTSAAMRSTVNPLRVRSLWPIPRWSWVTTSKFLAKAAT